MAGGRKSTLNFEKAHAILARMLTGEGLAPAARKVGVAPSTARNWFLTDPTGELTPIFERAQALRALMAEDEIFQLIEAGCSDANCQIRWRQKFIRSWLPSRFQPG